MNTHVRSRLARPARSHHRLGLPAASASVVGSVIGTGFFGIPSALAAFGPIGLVAVLAPLETLRGGF